MLMTEACTFQDSLSIRHLGWDKVTWANFRVRLATPMMEIVRRNRNRIQIGESQYRSRVVSVLLMVSDSRSAPITM